MQPDINDTATEGKVWPLSNVPEKGWALLP